ncbi:hypothetical protein KAR91_61900 [Candidatus Pacearchaeota archaeon]|nr:hypothetical protein [Candidatus Pacearchaeota archaeon]
MKKKRNPKGIGARRKDEKAYSRAIKKDILDPLLARTMAKLDSVPQIKAAYIRAVNEEFAFMTSGSAYGVVTVSVALDNIRRIHKINMIKSFRAALGVDINPFMSDLNIRPMMTQALFDNVALIKSIPQKLNLQIVGQFENIFREKGFDQQAMVKALKSRFKVANNRAKFIARDQTGKIVGQLNKSRQTDLGISSYTWQTSEDERVVGTPGGEYPTGVPGHMDHYIRNGETFLWGAPPPDGHPGEPFN